MAGAVRAIHMVFLIAWLVTFSFLLEVFEVDLLATELEKMVFVSPIDLT